MNNTTHTKFVDESNKNSFKTFLIMAGLSGFIIAVGFLIATTTGNSSYIAYALIFAIGQNLVSYFIGPKIALSTSGAVVADPEKYSDLHSIVESISVEANIKKPDVYIINDPAPNAFATGRGRSSSSVAVTTGLMAMLDRGELEGVIAHEVTHIKNRDILVMTAVVTMSAILSTIANMAMFASAGRDREGGNNIIFMIIGLAGSIVLPFAMMLIQMSISRKREFMADAGGAILSKHPEALASALQKIGGFRQPLQLASPATAHMYISCPFGGKEGQTFWQKLFLTHPPIEERVQALIG